MCWSTTHTSAFAAWPAPSFRRGGAGRLVACHRPGKRWWLDRLNSRDPTRGAPGRKLELSDDDVPHFLELWGLLEKGAKPFTFSIHRFNLAFDRGLLDDRIVDLVIAAEALLLGDLDEKYRGELRFRFALRAAKFIEHTNYSEHDVFRLMRRAYDARSAIVHAGSPPSDLQTFIDAIEELVRRGLRKALSMKEDGAKLRQTEYWENLIFSKPNLENSG